MLKDLGILIKEVATTSKAEGYYGFVYNVERYCFAPNTKANDPRFEFSGSEQQGD